MLVTLTTFVSIPLALLMAFGWDRSEAFTNNALQLMWSSEKNYNNKLIWDLLWQGWLRPLQLIRNVRAFQNNHKHTQPQFFILRGCYSDSKMFGARVSWLRIFILLGKSPLGFLLAIVNTFYHMWDCNLLLENYRHGIRPSSPCWKYSEMFMNIGKS